MSKSFIDRMNVRRKRGPSFYEKQRGPNTGAWEKTNFPLHRDQGQQTGISDWRRNDNSNARRIQP